MYAIYKIFKPETVVRNYVGSRLEAREQILYYNFSLSISYYSLGHGKKK